MARNFTEQEQEILNQVLASLLMRGISLDIQTDNGLQNARAIMKPFHQDPNTPVTHDAVLASANQLVSKLHYISPLAAEFNKLLVALTPDEVTNLQEFLRKYSLVGIDGSNAGFKNATLLLNWLKRGDGRNSFAVTIPNLVWGMEGFNRSKDPKNQLAWTEKPQTEKKIYGRHTAEDNPDRQRGELFSDKDTSREFINGRRNHAFGQEQQTPATPALDSSEEAFKQSALVAINNGRTHAQKDERQEVFDQELVKTGSYRLAYKAVQQVVKKHEERGY